MCDWEEEGVRDRKGVCVCVCVCVRAYVSNLDRKSVTNGRIITGRWMCVHEELKKKSIYLYIYLSVILSIYLSVCL